MPVDIDPKKTWGLQVLDTILFQSSAIGTTIARFKPIPLGFKWVIAFLAADSSSAFTVNLALDDPSNVFDTENIPGAGFTSANFPNMLLGGGRTVIAIMPPAGAGVLTVKLDLWGHIIF